MLRLTSRMRDFAQILTVEKLCYIMSESGTVPKPEPEPKLIKSSNRTETAVNLYGSTTQSRDGKRNRPGSKVESKVKYQLPTIGALCSTLPYRIFLRGEGEVIPK